MAYLYRHIRHDKNQPFYIGIGVTKEYGRAYSLVDRNRIWNSIANRTSYDVEIVFDDLTWEEAVVKEKEFIKIYGRIQTGGMLSNMTDGGDGGYGVIVSKETRAKLSALSLSRGITKETREKMAAKLRGRPQPQWQRDILSKAAKGKKHEWNCKPVCQFDATGKLVQDFESITHASCALNLTVSNIIKSIKGERVHCGGYLFAYKATDMNTVYAQINDLCQKLNDGELKIRGDNGSRKIKNIATGEVYESLADCARKEGITLNKVWGRLTKNKVRHYEYVEKY